MESVTDEDCKHPTIAARYTFDEKAARKENLTSQQVRKRWPRYHGPCPDCGVSLIYYASWAHYVWGDW